MDIAGIFENIISDFIFVLLSIALLWTILVITHRRKLLKFYGVDVSHRITVYLSNIRVQPYGAHGVNDQARSYQGTVAAFGEMRAAERFHNLFHYFIPSLSDSQGIMNKLLFSDVQVQLLASPMKNSQLVPSDSFITLGSPAYNAVSGFVEERIGSQARIRSYDRDNAIPETPQELELPFALGSYYVAPAEPTPSSSGSPFLAEQAHSAIFITDIPPITNPTYGFVERIVDPKKERTVFYVAGLSELGTAGAAHFLATSWPSLYRKYRDNASFLVLLRVEPADYRNYCVVLERGER